MTPEGGKLTADFGAFLNLENELPIVEKLFQEGNEVHIRIEASQLGKQGAKTSDAFVNGIETEFKSISDAENLPRRINKHIKKASSQLSENGNLIIDLRRQEGVTQEIVEQAFKESVKDFGKVQHIRAFGKDFDFVFSK